MRTHGGVKEFTGLKARQVPRYSVIGEEPDVIVPAWFRGTTMLAVTLAAGVALGVSHERRHASGHEAAGSLHIMRRLYDELGLDQAQQDAIAAILARRQGALDSTWHMLQPHVHAALDSTHREIVAVLRPQQAAQYRKLVEARHPGTVR